MTNVTVPKIKELNQALKGHAKLYEIELQDNLNPLNHFMKTRPLTELHLKDLLKTMKEFKFIETLDNLNPLNHFMKTRPLIELHLKDLLKTMKEFKFIETLEVTFEKDTIYKRVLMETSYYHHQNNFKMPVRNS